MKAGLGHRLLQRGKDGRAYARSQRRGERGVDQDEALDLAAQQFRIAAAERKHRHAADAVTDEDDRSVGSLGQQMQVFCEPLDLVNAITERRRTAQSRQVPQVEPEVGPQLPADMVPGAGTTAISSPMYQAHRT